ncbi:MAG: hypothetical protein HWE27_11780 [Gammaproteobacteria bacterium]|nr:hypothetical protein [Gammaproteobacteria bacterium]
MKFTCPCCGYKTLDLEPPGTFVICELCDWEDDSVQFSDPDYEGGANGYSLRQSQHRYANGYRAKLLKHTFEKDDSWSLLPEKASGTEKRKTNFVVKPNGDAKNT